VNALLSAGIIFFAFVVGQRALDGCLASGLRRSALARHVLALTLGMAMLTPLLVVLASAGLFHVPILGAIAWIGAAIGLLQSPGLLKPRRSIDLPDALALVAAIVFAIVSANGRDETLGSGRDQQIYAEAAVALSERGHASGRYSQLDEPDRILLRSFGGVLVPGLTRARNGVDEAISTTHPLGWPVWLALAHAMFGIDGVYAANALVFAWGGLLLFLLLRRIAAPGIAVVATCFFLALPSSIWIAGISLSEPLAMSFLLAVPLLAAAGIYRSRWRIAALMLAATLVRMDSALLIPVLIIVAMLVCVATPAPKTAMHARRFAFIQGATFCVALLIYLTLFPGYLRSVLQETAVIAVTSVALALALVVATPDSLTVLRSVIKAHPTRLVAIALLVGCFAYAAAIRPALQPFHLIQQASDLNGRRDFREESLRNLAMYVSWPILLFALAGLCYAIQRNWMGRQGAFRSLLLVIGIGPALLYLWSPQVSPDHPWAVRRFVPTIVPYVVLFSALFVHVLTSRLGKIGTAAGAAALIAPYAAIASDFPLQKVAFRENQGVTAQIETIARELPSGLIVALDADEDISSALFIAYGKPVAIVPRGVMDKAHIEGITSWILAKTQLGHPAWLLHGPQMWRTGAAISDLRGWAIVRRGLKPAQKPPATELAMLRSALLLSRIDGLDPTFATRMFGGERIWGARDGGFFPSEVSPFGQVRYTDGFAWIEVPASALRGVEALKVDVFSYARQGVSRWIALLIDGQNAWTGEVAPGVQTLRIPVSGRFEGETARIEIHSHASDATEMNTADLRKGLGIGLVGIRPLRAGEPKPNRPSIQGFRSRLALVGLADEPQQVSLVEGSTFVLDVANTGSEFWPSVRELGGPTGAIQIALRWYRRANRDEIVGDNRWALAISMLPGDRTRVRVPLAPVALDAKPLPPGEYEVRIGLVREKVALFADNGDEVVVLPVVVAR
jgi:hypothetical protein